MPEQEIISFLRGSMFLESMAVEFNFSLFPDTAAAVILPPIAEGGRYDRVFPNRY